MNEDSVSFYLWHANSGTTSHLTHTWSAFIDYMPIEPKPVHGLKGGQTQTFYLKETLFTPDHPDNLLSIGRIDDNGGKIVFGNHKAVLYNSKGNEVVNGKLSSNWLYPLNIY
ncbi:hypothetical protein L208DRAFT_1312205 [Tricholoma matsutake]|nr:hypothetical protein L208DRAFT_1312205 [Tricholoma matsutake 945]